MLKFRNIGPEKEPGWFFHMEPEELVEDWKNHIREIKEKVRGIVYVCFIFRGFSCKRAG
jgi:hypothetical protein